MALSRVLIKIFVAGFYKANAGFLTILLGTVFTCFFFVNVLNETHFPVAERVLLNLALVLSFLADPVMTLLILAIWIVYVAKSWKYVASQLLVPVNQFLFNGINAYGGHVRFMSWLIVQFLISIPVFLYVVFTVVIGFIYDFYVIPLISIAFFAVLVSVSALYYTRLTRQAVVSDFTTSWLRITRKWEKPFLSWFLFQILHRMKFVFMLIKVSSWLAITAVIFMLGAELDPLRLAGFATLGVVMIHTVLVYDFDKFERTLMGFIHNMPISRTGFFLHDSGLMLALLIPEIIYLFIAFPLWIACSSSVFGVGTLLLLRAALRYNDGRMSSYMRQVMALFVISFMILLLNVSVLFPAALAIAFITSYTQYYPLR